MEHVVKVLLDKKLVSIERLLSISEQFNTPYLTSNESNSILPPSKVLELITTNNYIISTTHSIDVINELIDTSGIDIMAYIVKSISASLQTQLSIQNKLVDYIILLCTPNNNDSSSTASTTTTTTTTKFDRKHTMVSMIFAEISRNPHIISIFHIHDKLEQFVKCVTFYLDLFGSSNPIKEHDVHQMFATAFFLLVYIFEKYEVIL